MVIHVSFELVIYIVEEFMIFVEALLHNAKEGADIFNRCLRVLLLYAFFWCSDLTQLLPDIVREEFPQLFYLLTMNALFWCAEHIIEELKCRRVFDQRSIKHLICFIQKVFVSDRIFQFYEGWAANVDVFNEAFTIFY